MKKYLYLASLLAATNATNLCYAESSSQFSVKANVVIKNIHGVVPSGTWFNLALEDNIIASTGSQHYKAKVVDPIYNKDFSEGLIPVGAVIDGTYINDNGVCSFSIDKISFKGTEIDLLPGAYSTVNASLPNQAECNPNLNYRPSQTLEFQTKVDIADLTPISLNKDYIVAKGDDNFVQSYGNSDYVTTSITKFTNGLMKVSVKFFNTSIKDKLVPIYFDELGLAHPLNFDVITTNDNPFDNINNTVSYLFTGKYSKFGFGVLE